MNLGLGNSFLSRDPQVIKQTVDEVKSQGIFDSFRRECIADVDTKPAYQNLRSKVEYSVNNFLNKQPWRAGMNKNQFRETVRNYIQTAPYLDTGVQCIVDQVVNPKIYSTFMPQIEDITYIHLGMEPPRRLQKNGNCSLKDLLPKDLDPVSPASDTKSVKEENWDNEGTEDNEAEKQQQSPKVEQVQEKKAEKPVENVAIKVEENLLTDSMKSEDKAEEEEEDSPVFEPIDIMNMNGSDDSYLSGISELTSHRDQSLSMDNEDARDHFEVSNQDSQLSKVSSNSRISIVTDVGSSNQACWLADDKMEKGKDSGRNFDIEMIKKGCSQDSKSGKSRSKKSESGSKESKEKSRDDSTKSKSSKDKPSSRDSKSHRDKEKYKDEDSQKRHLSSSSSHSSSSSKEKIDNANKSKDKRDENDGKEKIEKIEKKDKNDSTSKKDKNDKRDRNDKKDKYEKKDKNDKKDKKDGKDLKEIYKEKIPKPRESKESTEKDKHTKSSRDVKEKKDSSTDRKDVKKEHKSSSHGNSSLSRHDDRNSKSSKDSKSDRDKDRKDRSKKNDDPRKSSSSSSRKDDKKSKSGEKNEKSEKDKERSYKDKKHRDDKKKSKDDHSSHHKNSNDRRSTDRDGSSGFGGKNSNGLNDSSSCSRKSSSTNPSKDINIASQSSSETSDGVEDTHLNANHRDARQQSMFTQKRAFGDNSRNLETSPVKKFKYFENFEDAQRSVMSTSMKSVQQESFHEKIVKTEKTIKEDITVIPDDERVQIIEFPGGDDDSSSEDESPMGMEMDMKLMLSVQDFFPSKKNSVENTGSKPYGMDRTIRGTFNEHSSNEKLLDRNRYFQSSGLVSGQNSHGKNKADALGIFKGEEKKGETEDRELEEDENSVIQTPNEKSPQPIQGSSRPGQQLSSPENDCLYLNAKEEENHRQQIFLFMKNLKFNEIEGSQGQHVSSVAKTMAPPGVGSKRCRGSVGNPNNNYSERSVGNNLDFQEPLAKKKRGRPKKQKSEDRLCSDENFMMSPESDVSSASEKSSGSRDGRMQQKSRQHYTSDDLYKPRPLFGSSSRRKRRSSPA